MGNVSWPVIERGLNLSINQSISQSVRRSMNQLKSQSPSLPAKSAARQSLVIKAGSKSAVYSSSHVTLLLLVSLQGT